MVDNREERALDKVSTEDTYRTIRGYVIDAQRQVYSAVNSAMVLAYHEIGEQIYRACGENDRAEYGKTFCSICPSVLRRSSVRAIPSAIFK